MILRSFTSRLIRWYSLVLGIVIIGFGIYTYLGLQRYLISSLQHILTQRANQIAMSLIPRSTQVGEDHTIKEITTLYAPENNNRFIRILRKDGSLLYVSGLPKDHSFDPSKVSLPNQDMDTVYQRNEQAENNYQLYISTVPVYKDHTKHFWVEVGASDTDITSTLYGLMTTLVIAFPALILLAAGGGYLLIKRSLSPVTQIIDSAENISLRNLSQRLPATSNGDVFEHLSNTLNRMIARLENSFLHISQFTSDASHELRTPLTILHMELELLAKTAHLPKDLREKVSSAIEETERLSKITEGLFAISQLDTRDATILKMHFDLSDLVTTTVEQLILLAEAKNVLLHLYTESQVTLQGDSGRIKQVIVNLLNNAIKYTPPEGEITARVYAKEDKAILEVSDTGIGIAEESLPYIFDRFYRTDKARSRDDGGAGLGLSIVRSICIAHDGTVTARSEESKGSVFTVKLPLAKP